MVHYFGHVFVQISEHPTDKDEGQGAPASQGLSEDRHLDRI